MTTPNEVIARINDIKTLSDQTARRLDHIKLVADRVVKADTSDTVQRICKALFDLIENSSERLENSRKPMLYLHAMFEKNPEYAAQGTASDMKGFIDSLGPLAETTRDISVISEMLENDILFLDLQLRTQSGTQPKV
jgi:uncharacterized protein (UPF0262 family)